MAQTLRHAALAEALTHKGARETSTNWSPLIKEFLAAAKLKAPAPWCAAFVNFCAQIAAMRLDLATPALLDIVSPLEQVPLEAYVQSYVDYGRKHGWVIPPEQVRPGDLFCLYYPSLGRYGHIGFVTRMRLQRGVFDTIEGNTNAEGSREGNAVAEKTRPVTRNVLFLRYTA